MATITEVYRRVKQLNLGREVPAIIRRTKDRIVEIQQDQMYEGKTSRGTRIFPDGQPWMIYAPLTIYLKTHERTPPQPVDRVTLKDTGAFYRGITVKNINRDKFEITSTSRKTKKLEERYGKIIFGLDKESRAQYIEESFRPQLNEYIEETTKLRMK